MGFGEAIGIAVVLVVAYIGLSAVVVANGFWHVFENPSTMTDWTDLVTQAHASPLAVLGASLLVFPALALGLSGFETGVVVMPLVKGVPDDTVAEPAGRIRNAQKLLSTAALIMSVMLIGSAIVTTFLSPAAEFEPGGDANGRALAYLAHENLGDGFGTAYDIATIGILWFAGASAMAGLLNIVPRYLPRYGMAPDWARATRPLVLVFTFISTSPPRSRSPPHGSDSTGCCGPRAPVSPTCSPRSCSRSVSRTTCPLTSTSSGRRRGRARTLCGSSLPERATSRR